MEAFSDDEFYEARDEISSASGSDESSPDEDDDAAAEISGRHQQQPQQQQRSGSRRQQQQERANKPPRHNQPPQCLAESRFSVWQDGPKSIQERRKLLYERFGILGRKGEGSEGGENATTSPDGAQIRLTRFGIRGEHLSPARKGVGRTWNSSAGIASSEPTPLNKPNGSTTDQNNNNAAATAAPSAGDGSDDNNKRLHSESESSKALKDADPLTLGRSRSDSAAVLADGKLGNFETGGAIARSVSASPQFIIPGIERLTQTSGAVLREGKRGPSSSKPPTGNRALGASKSAPSSLHNLGAGHGEDVSNNGAQSLSVVDRQDGFIRPSAAASPIRTLTKSSRIVVTDGSPTASQTWAVGDGGSDLGRPDGQLASNSVSSLVDAIQTMTARQSNEDRSFLFDENINDVSYKIKDLDSGKEFIIDESGADGDPKLRELDTGKELTLKEFESSLGLSPVMQEVRRREREQDSLDDDDAAQGHHDSTASSKKKKKSLWVTMKGVAKTVGAVSKSRSHHDSSRMPNEGSRGESGVEDREGSVGKDSHREGSFDKCRKPRTKSVSEDPAESVRPRSPQRVKVQVYKKNYKDLSDLYMGQEIQAHQGAIWTMKFSLDGRYLASAGQDRVVHVREVLDHPFAKDQGGAAGDALEASGGKAADRIGATTPEHLQHSQECSQGRRGSLRGSVGKRKSAKRSSSAKLPKLFWLSETPIYSFKGHTEDVLDLSWSRTQFLLSSSMDQTVRLWHMSYNECLRVFTHNDYVTTIEFSPTDDRYFLSGSLDDKVRLWNIPDHQVVDWSDVREMVTAVSYSPDGKRAVIGTYKGTCRFYNTTGQKLKLEGQIDVRNAQSKKSRGKKITGLQFVPGDSNKVLITSNDSRVRVYEGSELNLKFKGLRNINSQISASFSRSGEYIISASEDSRVFIWNSGLQEFRGSRKDKPQSYEHFPSSHVSIALPWSGMDPPSSAVGPPKEDPSEEVEDTSSSRQSTNDGPLLSPLRCSPCSSSSSSSNGSTHSESGLTSESVGECKSEQSISFSIRNGSGRDIGDDEVTSRRSDGNGAFLGHFDKAETTLHSSFRESVLRDSGTTTTRPSASSPALSVSNESPPPLGGLTSLRSPTSPAGFFADVTTPKGGGSATWPEEKLPPLQDSSARSQGGSWSASSPSQDILSTELSPEGSTAGDGSITMASWGLVIVTASLSGEIRTFQNYGYPIRL